MNTKVDPKSALLGLVLGVIATAAIGAVSSPGQVGRYQRDLLFREGIGIPEPPPSMLLALGTGITAVFLAWIRVLSQNAKP